MFKCYHEVTDNIVQVTDVVDNKVHCVFDFGTMKKNYVFEVDAENASKVEQKMKELEEITKHSEDEESSEELSVFAFAPNSLDRSFRNIRIGN